MSLDLSEYKKISLIIFMSFFICIGILVVLNANVIEAWIKNEFGQICTEIFKQFFYGALGGTIACSLFLKKDKEINEVESLKDNPDPQILRLPDNIDKRLYVQRIITSGVLAVLGTIIIIAGLSYLEIEYKSEFDLKQKMLFVISSLLIGLYQFKFLGSLEKLYYSFFKTGK